MFPPDLVARAAAVVEAARARGATLATAESCTGGLVAALLTEVPGSSAAVACGFVTYSNAAKVAMLGVPEALLAAHGAVSEPVARAMAEGARGRSRADFAVALTGIAGPGGGSEAKPVGLVHVALAGPGGTAHHPCRFGDLGRGAVRLRAVERALAMLADALEKTQNDGV